MITTGIRTLFLATNSINSLIGGCFIGVVPQGTKVPANAVIVLTEMKADPNQRLDGMTGAIRFTDIDIDCKAATPEKANDIADAIEAFFNDYTGAAGSQTVKAVLFNDRMTSFEPPQDKSDQGKHVTTLDYTIQWIDT